MWHMKGKWMSGLKIRHSSKSHRDGSSARRLCLLLLLQSLYSGCEERKSVSVPVPSVTHCEISGKALKFPKPQFPHLSKDSLNS